jgi:hypothetical protein
MFKPSNMHFFLTAEFALLLMKACHSTKMEKTYVRLMVVPVYVDKFISGKKHRTLPLNSGLNRGENRFRGNVIWCKLCHYLSGLNKNVCSLEIGL